MVSANLGSWPDVKRSCVHVSTEKCPPLLSDVRAACTRGGSSLALLRQAVRSSDLPSSGLGVGPLLEDAMVLPSAVFTSVAFFGVSRASEVAALRVSDACISGSASDVEISVRRRRRDQYDISQMAHMVARPSWKDACPVGRAVGPRRAGIVCIV